jgi:hypothetical protein
MGLTTYRVVAEMCKTRRWAFQELALAGWFIIEGRRAYWDEMTGEWLMKDKEFLREMNAAFTAAFVKLTRA